MAANERAKSAGYSSGGEVLAAELTTIDTNAANAINRNSTTSGWKTVSHTISVQRDSSGHIICYPYSSRIRFTGTAGSIWLPTQVLPHGHTVKDIRMQIQPAGDHVAEPAVLPKMVLWKNSINTCAAVGSASYTWVSTAAYESSTPWLSSGTLTHVIDLETYNYPIQIVAESGANAKAGLQLYYVQVYVSCDKSSGGTDFSFWL